MKTDTAHLAGKTTWQAIVYLDYNDDPFGGDLGYAERPNLGLAKAWVNRNLPLLAANDGRPGQAWAQLSRGTYEGFDFDDDEYGQIEDAAWERDDDAPEWWAYLDSDGISVSWSGG